MSAPAKILVATDFSSHSDAALETGVEFAKQFGAELHVTHVYHLMIPLVTPYEVTLPDPYIEETRRAAARQLDEVVAKARAAGMEATAHLIEGPAASAIAEIAEEIGADLLVLGTRGLTGLKHVMLGSVAAHVLRLAPCSVLTVKAAHEDD